ncbi:biofilm associated protein A [Pseudomonas chlororaphis O6]|uniref:Biofilm associated protein A n=1 Tax=Pseudomonas chlororaphis O6 TaxID=1037915 RepID=A0AB33X068_9PSED|nr:biofilm associated protein A [Pseudomonas chlororaphis O6]
MTIIDNGNVIGEVVVGGNGSWEFTPAPLEEGNHNFEVVVTDPNGNSSEPSDPWPVVIDTTAPEKPGLGGDGHGLGDILDDVGDIQGSITPGGVTDDTKPTLVGTGEPGDTVTIIDNGNVIGSVVVGENGQWTFTPAEELAEGQHDFSVIFTDPAGNSSEASDPWPVLIDTMAPEKPQIGEVIDDIGSVTGPIGSGEVTDDNKPTLSGSGEAGGTVTIIDNGQVIGETVVDENGQWTFTPEEALEDGEHKFEVVITDPAGNSSEPSDGHVVIIDTAAPNKPVIEEVIDDIGSITGPIDSGDVTDDNKPTLSGSGEPGDTVTIIDNGNAIGEVVVDEKGEWTFTPEVALEDGKHEFEVVITDPAGNSSEPSDPYVVIIDTQAPSKPTIDTVYDDQGDKQGNLIAGETTDDAKPTISGKAEAGSTVVIMDKGQEIGRAQANEAGEWTFTPSTPLGNGGHDLSVKAIDAAGNASEPSDNFGFNVIAGGAPSMPAITAVKDDVGSIQGNLQKNAVTDDSKPTIEGTAEAGATVSIYSNGTLLGTTVADAAGQWSFTPETELANGLHNLTATATNLAGNVSPATGVYPITVDTVAPEADNGAKLYDDVGQIQGVIKSGDTTDDNLPTLKGQSEPNATVVIYDNGQKIGEAKTDAEGNWSFTPSTPLVDGAHNFVTEVIDQAGNVGEKSAGTAFTVDTRAVEISITKAVDDAGSKTGNLAKGDVTDDATPTLSGKATAGGIVKIYDGATLLGQTTADAQGNWSFTPAALADGLHNLTATVTTEAKGESEHTSIFDLTVDTTAPNKPGIDDAQDDVGAIQGSIGNGKHTDDTTPTLSGKGEPGSTVNIYDKGDLLGSATVGENGEWTFTPTSPLVDGEHSFTVTNVDKAGNVSEPSDAYVVIVDTAAPNKPSIDTVFDDQGDKQGNLIAGETTDDAKPAISGKAEAGSTVVIMDKGQEIGRAQANEAGEWTFTPATPLANGGHDLSVKAIDAAGNASEPSDNFDFNVIAGGAPAMPAITAVKDDIGSIQGNLQKNAVTDDSKPTIEGTAEAGATVSIYSNGNLLGTTVADAAGQWSFTPETELTDGLHNLTATATNLAGNISPSTGLYPITVDTQAPSADNAAELHDDVGQIQGVIKSGDTTDDNLPTLTGKAEGNATVVIYDNGQKIGETKTDADGNWSFTPSTPLVDGAHNFVTEVIDQAGNVGEKSAGTDFIVDTRAVEISITKAVDDAGSKQGNLAKGDVTDDATPTLSGKATAGGIVKLYDGATLLGQTTADAQGNWSFTPAAALADGVHNLTATVTTEAKGESAPTAIFDLTVDTTAPNKPGIDDAQDDVGAIQGSVGNGKHTDDTTPTLSGKGEPGSSVNIYDKGDLLGSVTVDENGKWTFTPTSPLVDGEHSFTVTNVDKAGNVSEVSPPYVVIVDTAAPTQTATVTSMGKDSGFDSGDWLTNDGSAGRLMQGTLSATLAAHEALQVSTDGGVTWVDALVEGIDWSAQDNNSHDESWKIQTRVIDNLGQVGVAVSQSVTFDTIAPISPLSVEQVASAKFLVKFDPSALQAGDRVNLVFGNARYDYILTEADISKGEALVSTNFIGVGGVTTSQSTVLAVAFADQAGNLSAHHLSNYWDFNSVGGAFSKFTNPLMVIEKIGGDKFEFTPAPAGAFEHIESPLNSLHLAKGGAYSFSLATIAREVSMHLSLTAGASGIFKFYSADGILLGQLDSTTINDGILKFVSSVAISSFTYESGADGNGIWLDNISIVHSDQDYSLPENQSVASSGSNYHSFFGSEIDTTFTIGSSVLEKTGGIYGGGGVDTLKLSSSSSGLTLDLGSFAGNLSSVEVFNITGAGDNILKLSLVDVLGNGAKNLFADDDNVQLMVKGDTGDRVELSDLLGADGMDTGDWSEKDQLTSDGVVYHVYQHSGMAAEVLVQDGVQVNLI